MAYIRLKKQIIGFILCLPLFATLGIVIVYPMARVLWLTFNKVDLFSPFQTEFVGIENLVKLARNPDFLSSLQVTLYWTGACVILQTLIGLGAALLLNSDIKGRNLARGLVMFPYIMPVVIAVLIWKYMYNDLFGVINYLLIKLNMIHTPIVWFGDPHTALLGLVVLGTWKFFPFVVICLLAALQSISLELYEAAKVDGANCWQRFKYVTLPLLWPTLLVVMLIRTIWTFNKFDIIYMATGGGPVRLTTTLPILMYEEAFNYFNLGRASAMGTYTLLILALITFTYYRYIKES